MYVWKLKIHIYLFTQNLYNFNLYHICNSSCCFTLDIVFNISLIFWSYSILELIDFKTRRVAAFKKNLADLAELEIKHAKVRKNPVFSFVCSYNASMILCHLVLCVCPWLKPSSSNRGLSLPQYYPAASHHLLMMLRFFRSLPKNS